MILVVEDHADTRHVLIKPLRLDGYEAVGTDCGDAALDYPRENTPRLVILDCNMPGLDGLEVLRRIRAEGRLKPVPVIMFSAAGDPVVQETAMELGAQAYISKGSLDWAALSQAVARFIAPAD